MNKFCCFLLTSLLALSSCTEAINPDKSDWEEWALTESFCNFCLNPGDVKTYDQTDTTYVYRFKKDSSFVKNIGDYVLSGKFQVEENNDNLFLLLNYDEESVLLSRDNPSNRQLIHTCFSGQEYFSWDSDGRLLGSWGACDGPTLIFEKTSDTQSIFF